MTGIITSGKISWQQCIRNTRTIAFCLWGAALGINEAQAAPQPAFNLVCTSQKGESFRFRFDLQKKKFCIDECHSVGFINELGDGFIKLSIESLDSSDRYIININRYTSEFWIVRVGYGSTPKYYGSCKSQSFSGFPEKAF